MQSSGPTRSATAPQAVLWSTSFVSLSEIGRARRQLYLLLIIPGRVGDHLRRQLNNVSVSLIGNTFTTVLTCSDPTTFAKDRQDLPPSSRGVNLGLQNVTPAELKPQVDLTEDHTKIVCISCFAKCNPESWASLCGSNFKQTRSAVIKKIRALTMLTSFDL